ncbi:MAG: TetR/AcrR family transcriptional regulator [Acidimicrobiales bacterium]
MDATKEPDAAGRGYHHGDLRRALIEAALEAVGDDGAANVRLRDVARRAGVSHAAPAHHFGDKAGLLTAIAVDGFELLAAALTDAYGRTASLLEVGVAYVRFAVDHRAHFDVMFRPELYRADAPVLAGPKAAAAAALYGPLGAVIQDDGSPDQLTPFVAAWSLVHGLATLLLTENLPVPLGHDPEQITRRVAGYIFPASTTR